MLIGKYFKKLPTPQRAPSRPRVGKLLKKGGRGLENARLLFRGDMLLPKDVLDKIFTAVDRLPIVRKRAMRSIGGKKRRKDGNRDRENAPHL